MVFLCLTIEVYINCFANSLQLQFYSALILYWYNQNLLQIFLCDLLLLECNKHQSSQYPAAHCWQKSGDDCSTIQTDADNDWVLYMKQKGPSVPLSGLYEFHYHGKCVKLNGWKIIFLYYLAHISSVLLLFHFWWRVTVFSMANIWWTPVEVSSEITIQVLAILFHLWIYPPYSCCLMMFWTISNSEFYVELGSGIVPSLRNKSSTILPSRMIRFMSPSS